MTSPREVLHAAQNKFRKDTGITEEEIDVNDYRASVLDNAKNLFNKNVKINEVNWSIEMLDDAFDNWEQNEEIKKRD